MGVVVRVVACLTVGMVMVRVIMGMVVVAMAVVGIEELGVDLQLGIQIEAAQVEHLRDRHLAEMHLALRRSRVHVLDAVHQRLQGSSSTSSLLLMKIWSANPTWRRASWRASS